MKNDRTVMCYFPDASKASSLRVVQDPISQIRGFYFTKSQIISAEELEHVNNYAVYFLFSDLENPSVYIGQSTNGITRIKSHLRKKDFWTFAILFVTDNSTFNKSSIDYLEHYFIKEFSKTQYVLENVDLRSIQPNSNVFTQATLRSYSQQIEFLLEALGISLQPLLINDLEELEYFHASEGYQASIYLHDGKFVLRKGSIIRKPVEAAKTWRDQGKFHERFMQHFNNYIDTNQAILIGEKSAELTSDIAFSSPSMAAKLCSGRSTNGWTFWKGLKDKRERAD